ncbi:MAG TPA: gamma-glutamyltransferase [Polyangiaceae bacterium]|nr:gamma-glutamyltransferase [Polyangiaceae bacterium]
MRRWRIALTPGLVGLSVLGLSVLGLAALGCESRDARSAQSRDAGSAAATPAVPSASSTAAPLGSSSTAPSTAAGSSPGAAAGTDTGTYWELREAELPTPSSQLSLSPTGLVQGSRGLVASVERQATEVGVELLRAGGNAVDAAVGVAFALAVTHPSAGNLGGGGFLLAKMGNRVEGFDFRESAPAALGDEQFRAMIAAGGKGPRSVGVPGTVAGLLLAHQRSGRLPLAKVLGPAEKLAREGFLWGRRQVKTIVWAQAELAAQPEARELFLVAGKPPKEGSRGRNPGLADVIARIAARGAAGFYEGETATELLEGLGPSAHLSRDDLRNYRARLRQPLVFDFAGARIVTMPPPSGGGVALAQALLELGQLDVAQAPNGSAARVHLLAEASRRAQLERRLFVVDPDTLSPSEYDAARKRWLDPTTWLANHPVGKRATPSSSLHESFAQAQRELEHTTHLSVLDAEGNAATCTITLSASFGSRIVAGKTGIVMNNSAASFSTMGVNRPVGGRRTISSMAPTLAFVRERGFFALGSPGGDTIPSTLTQVLVHLLLDDMNLASAVDAARIHQGFVPDELTTESSHPLPPAVEQRLRALGHVVRSARVTQGDVHAVALLNGVASAYSDSREGGVALAVPTP